MRIEVARSPYEKFISQRKYTLAIITKTGLLDTKPIGYSIEQDHTLSLTDEELYNDSKLFRRLVRRLIYLLFTQPDMTHIVHILSQFMQHPRHEHWKFVLRDVRYSKGCPDHRIMLSFSSDFYTYLDCVIHTGQLVPWLDVIVRDELCSLVVPRLFEKPRNNISLSIFRQDRVSFYGCNTSKLKWSEVVLTDMGVQHSNVVSLFCGSKYTLHIAQNHVFMNKSNISILIVIMCVMQFKEDLLPLTMYL